MDLFVFLLFVHWFEFYISNFLKDKPLKNQMMCFLQAWTFGIAENKWATEMPASV